MAHIVICLFTVAGLAAVIGSPAKFRELADPPERPHLNDLERSTFNDEV